jgi:hypothetical protein
MWRETILQFQFQSKTFGGSCLSVKLFSVNCNFN